MENGNVNCKTKRFTVAIYSREQLVIVDVSGIKNLLTLDKSATNS